MAATVSLLVIRGTRKRGRGANQPPPAAVLDVRLPAIGSSSALYAPALVQVGLVNLPLLSSSSALYPPLVLKTSSVALPLMASASTLYPPSLKQNIVLPLLASSSVQYGMQVAGAAQISMPILVGSSTFYGPTISQNMLMAHLPSSSQLYAPVIVRRDDLYLPLLGSSSALYGMGLKLNMGLPHLPSSSLLRPPAISIVSGGYTLSTPVVTLTTAAGAIPEVDITMGADIWAGFTLRIQRSTTGAKNVSDGSYVSPTVNIAHMVTADEIHEDVLAITADSLIADGYVNPESGVPWFQQYRWEREDGAISAWSNQVSGTVTSATTALYTVSGFNKKAFLTVSGSPALVATGRGDGAPQSVRCTASKTGKRQFEATVTSYSDNYVFLGVEDGTTDLDLGYPAPGITNANGVALRITSGGFSILKAGVSVSNGSTNVASGDVLTAVFDTSAATMSFYRTRSGSTVQIGSTVTGIGLGTWQAFLGAYSASTLTANFGQSAFTRALDTGYAMYG